MRIGTSLHAIVTYNAERGLYGTGRIERLRGNRLESFVKDRDPVRVRLFQTSGQLKFVRRISPMAVLSPLTPTSPIRSAPRKHSPQQMKSLEARVRERTMELLRLNDELSRAKAAADDANLSKTKFWPPRAMTFCSP